MIISVPSKSFYVTFRDRTVAVADTPRLRFKFDRLRVNPTTGELMGFELPEPLYEDPKDLMDQPVTGRRFLHPIPAYPSTITRTERASILSTQNLQLDISRAFMTHLCKEAARPGQPKRVRPLYRLALGPHLPADRTARRVDDRISQRCVAAGGIGL